MKLSVSDIPRMAATLKPHVDTLLAATAIAELERDRVDAIQRKVLANMGYSHVEPKYAWQLADDTAAEYHKRLNEWHLADGFEDAAKGYCPALCAEHTKTQAEWALISAAEEFFPDATNDRLLCGTAKMGGLETRQKYLDLLIGLVVNQPDYTNPLERIMA